MATGQGIGETLRETRLQARIELARIESDTKIRAKYLRALENEDWEILPGPSFVSAFLRTYADYLGLDGRALVEAYRGMQPEAAPPELTPFAARSGRRDRRDPLLTPPLVLGLGVVAVLALLVVIGIVGGDDPQPAPVGGVTATSTESTTTTTTGRSATVPTSRRSKTTKRRRRTRVSLRIIPSGEIYVCLKDGDGKTLVNQIYSAGDKPETVRARRLKVTFGNGQATMRVNGRSVEIPSRGQPTGFDLRPNAGASRLPDDERPNCA